MERFNLLKRGGYDPEEVNRYIATLEQVIKSYKDKDNAIKNALISAEVAADNIIRNARLQAEEYKHKAIRQLDSIIGSVSRQRGVLIRFQDEYNLLVQKYLKSMDNNETADLHAKLDEMETMIRDLQDKDIMTPATRHEPVDPVANDTEV